jgi:hypothetical protein
VPREKTSVSIDPDVWQNVRVETARRGMDKSDAVEEGLRWWLSSAPPPDSLDGLDLKDRQLMIRAAVFLRSDSTLRGDLRKVLTDMLNLFERMSR